MIPPQEYKIEEVCEKIILDHLNYSCYPSTLSKLTKIENIKKNTDSDDIKKNAPELNEKEKNRAKRLEKQRKQQTAAFVIDAENIEEIKMRREIISLIKSKQSYSAIPMLKLAHLYQPVLKQSFVEAVEREDYFSAIEIAEKYTKKYGSDPVFAAIGYSKSEEKIQSEGLELAQTVNEELYTDKCARSVALIDLLWYHYKKNKIDGANKRKEKNLD